MRENTSDPKPTRAGIFDTVEETQRVVRELLDFGFTEQQITVICSDDTKERYFRRFKHQDPAGAHAPAAAAAGGLIGAALTGTTAAVAAVTTGGTALFALGPLIAGTGGIVGGLVGAMMTRGIEKEAANFYDQEVAAGKLLVAVEYHGDDEELWLAKASEILVEAGAKSLPLPEG